MLKMGDKEADRMFSNAQLTLLTMRRHSRVGGCSSETLHSYGKGGIEGRHATSQPGAKGIRVLTVRLSATLKVSFDVVQCT